jgi:hypothetical protein
VLLNLTGRSTGVMLSARATILAMSLEMIPGPVYRWGFAQEVEVAVGQVE